MPRGITSGIIYIPLDVRWPRSKKVRAMIVRHGLDGFAAWALYLAMASYCRENLTDGYVPADEIGALAYPLKPDDADRLVGLLVEARLLDHSGSDGTGHSNSHSPSDGIGHSRGYLVRAYVKRNGTRADTLAAADRRSVGGKNGADRRWSDGRMANAIGGAMAQAVPDRDIDIDRPRARAGARAPAREGSSGWSPSGVLDRPPARRPPAPRDSAAVLAEQYRPGGPATDEQRAARADQARKGLANRPARLDQPDAGPTAGLTGEALARAQLAEIEQRRAAERAIEQAATAAAPLGDPGPVDADPLGPLDPPWPDDDGGDPLGLDGGTERELPTGETYVDHGDPIDDPGRVDADEPGRGDQTDDGQTEPGEDQYPF